MISQIFWAYVLVMVVLWGCSSALFWNVPSTKYKIVLDNANLVVNGIVKIPAWMAMGMPVMITIYAVSIIWGWG